MNLSKSSFLCLDIGTYGVRGIAHTVINAKIEKSAMFFVKNNNTAFALKSVIDELERQLNTNFDSAYITGNFGIAQFKIDKQETSWNDAHKITEYDIKQQTNKKPRIDGFFPMHVIPVIYKTPLIPDIKNSPVNHIDTQLKSYFSIIYYEEKKTAYIDEILRNAHIKPIGFFDPVFLNAAIYKKPNERVFFIDLGAEFTTIAIWLDRGPLFFKKIRFGQTDITNALAVGLDIESNDADSLKIAIANTIPNENERFNPAAETGRFAAINKSDINDIFQPKLLELVNTIKAEADRYIEQYQPTKIILTGGGAAIEQIDSFIQKHFDLPVENHGESASLSALADYIWETKKTAREAYEQRKLKFHRRLDRFLRIFKRKKIKKIHKIVPILPSTLCFDMNDKSTYTMFASSGISMIHVDIMDGLYVNNIAGGIDQLEEIRSKTKAHLHVHLMTQAPAVIAADAINAGADTVILSADTVGVKNAIKIIKKTGKRCGVALNPDLPASFISDILPYIDEVMVMAVKPGAAGQEFDKNVLSKIKAFDYTRKKHGLKYLISVDGGIDPETAKLCWDAGANLLVSGSYLKNAPDFRLAVQSLLKH